MSLLEGMAAGRPVLAHDIAGVPELVQDGVEGFVLPLHDPAAYAARLGCLLTDPTLRKRMGQAARQRAAAFGWDRVADAVESFYNELTHARNERRSAR